MQFEEYLLSKKIDKNAFKKSEPLFFEELTNVFEQMHPDSFTAQKLFLINPLRRKFPLSQQAEEATKPSVSKTPKPIIKPKTKEI